MWEGSSVWWWVEECVWMVVGGGVRDRELHCAAIASGATDCSHTAQARTMATLCVITAAVTTVCPPPSLPPASKVFFPMLSRLLEGVELMDAPSLEETRMRASQLLSKVHTCTAHTHLMSIYVHMLIKWAHSVVVGHAA